MAEERKSSPKKSRSSKTTEKATGYHGEFSTGEDTYTALIHGPKGGIKAVQYTVLGGECIVEGDISIGTEEQVARRNSELRDVLRGTVALGVVHSSAQRRWPNCVVPFQIDSGLTNQGRVTDAIAHWESRTRYRFVERTAANAGEHPDWVTFRPASGCSSAVGRIGGEQFINLGTACSLGNAIHEIGHAIGLWHEQSREDRDAFVTINWDKIQPGLEGNFNQHISDGDDHGPYDYGSIMHYPRTAFSVDGSETITPTDPNAQIGQRNGLSNGDVAAANSLCPFVLPTFKEGPKDRIKENIKELVKEPPKDFKEPVKENLKERIKEPPKDFKEPFKEGAKDIKEPTFDPTRKELVEVTLPQPVVQPGPLPFTGQPVTPGVAVGGTMPFAVATAQQAAGFTAAQPDPLAALQQALAQIEASHAELQQQHQSLAAMAQQILGGLGGGGVT